MTQITAEPIVSTSEEPLLAPPEDPLSSEGPCAAPEKTIAKCVGECKRCIVQAIVERMNQQRPLGRTEAHDLQRRFDYQAFGYKGVADKYVLRLDQQERSLEQMEARVAGCDKISNGSRLLTQALLEHSTFTLDQKLAMERAQYVSPISAKGPARKDDEKPYVPPAPAPTVTQHLLKSLGSFSS